MGFKNKSIIELLEDNELKIGELYKIYSEKIPEYRDFWLKISNEEFGHAEMIGNMRGKDDEKFFVENKYLRNAIKYVVDYVKGRMTEVKKNSITQAEALNNALRIEQSILEKKYFEIFTPASPAIENLMNKLNDEVNRHIKILKNELKKIK